MERHGGVVGTRRLTARRRAAPGMRLDREIKLSEDHVIILDTGPADQVDPRVESLGKSLTPIRREALAA